MLACLLLLATSVAAQGPTQIKPGFNLFTKQQDVQLGQEAAAKIRKQATIVHDATLNTYVNAVGRRLMSFPGGAREWLYFHLRSSCRSGR